MLFSKLFSNKQTPKAQMFDECKLPRKFLIEVAILSRHIARVSDQLSDRLIFGRLFQANEKFSTFQSCANL